MSPFLEKPLARLRMRNILKHIPQGEVLDIGCGPAPELLLRLATRISEGWGIDKKVEEKRWSNKVQTIKKDLDADPYIPFDENKFDCLIILAVLEHFQLPEKILKEAYRVLKPNGIIIITTPAPAAKPILEFLAYRLGIVSKEEIRDHKNYFPKKELIRLLKGAGFFEIFYRRFDLGFNQLIIGKKL